MNLHNQEHIKKSELKLGYAMTSASGSMRALLIASAILFPKMLLRDLLEGPAQKMIESLVAYGEILRRGDRNGHSPSCRVGADTHFYVSRSFDSQCALAVMKYSKNSLGNEVFIDAGALMGSPTDGWSLSHTTTNANSRKSIETAFSCTIVLFALAPLASNAIDSARHGRKYSPCLCVQGDGYAEMG